MKKKDNSIETLRGLAILLVIAGHVIGNTGNRGMQVADDSIWRYFYYSLVMIRMPLFTVISGYVYAMRPVESGKETRFIKGKFRRIILPMVFVGALQYLFKVFAPGVNQEVEIQDIWRIAFFSFDHFWFLQSIFIIFLIVTALDSFKLMQTIERWFIVLIAVSVLFLLIPIKTVFFSISGAIFLFPFFIFGYGMNRFKLDTKKPYFIVALILTAAGVLVHQLNWYNVISINVGNYSPLGLVVGIAGTFCLFYIRKDIKILTRLGYYAYGIYLFHVFGSAGSRVFLGFLGITNDILLFTIGLIFGIFVPIVIEQIIELNKITRRLFLGLK